MFGKKFVAVCFGASRFAKRKSGLEQNCKILKIFGGGLYFCAKRQPTSIWVEGQS
jgi:hypothetical protein